MMLSPGTPTNPYDGSCPLPTSHFVFDFETTKGLRYIDTPLPLRLHDDGSERSNIYVAKFGSSAILCFLLFRWQPFLALYIDLPRHLSLPEEGSERRYRNVVQIFYLPSSCLTLRRQGKVEPREFIRRHSP
jgi:hypothetical protein